MFWGLKNINLNALFHLKFIREASNHDRAVLTALRAHATTETFGESAETTETFGESAETAETFGESAETAPSNLESEFVSSPA